MPVQQVQLANPPEVLVEIFYEEVDEAEHGQFVLAAINREDARKASVVAIDKFRVLVLHEVAPTRLTGRDGQVDVLLYASSVVVFSVPSGKADPALYQSCFRLTLRLMIRKNRIIELMNSDLLPLVLRGIPLKLGEPVPPVQTLRDVPLDLGMRSPVLITDVLGRRTAVAGTDLAPSEMSTPAVPAMQGFCLAGSRSKVEVSSEAKNRVSALFQEAVSIETGPVDDVEHQTDAMQGFCLAGSRSKVEVSSEAKNRVSALFQEAVSIETGPVDDVEHDVPNMLTPVENTENIKPSSSRFLDTLWGLEEEWIMSPKPSSAGRHLRTVPSEEVLNLLRIALGPCKPFVTLRCRRTLDILVMGSGLAVLPSFLQPAETLFWNAEAALPVMNVLVGSLADPRDLTEHWRVQTCVWHALALRRHCRDGSYPLPSAAFILQRIVSNVKALGASLAGRELSTPCVALVTHEGISDGKSLIRLSSPIPIGSLLLVTRFPAHSNAPVSLHPNHYRIIRARPKRWSQLSLTSPLRSSVAGMLPNVCAVVVHCSQFYYQTKQARVTQRQLEEWASQEDERFDPSTVRSRADLLVVDWRDLSEEASWRDSPGGLESVLFVISCALSLADYESIQPGACLVMGRGMALEPPSRYLRLRRLIPAAGVVLQQTQGFQLSMPGLEQYRHGSLPAMDLVGLPISKLTVVHLLSSAGQHFFKYREAVVRIASEQGKMTGRMILEGVCLQKPDIAWIEGRALEIFTSAALTCTLLDPSVTENDPFYVTALGHIVSGNVKY
ncbi:MAG: uncharacterized protein KVP18_002810 [Porospora cf. gigantea A]|nr:MAG: hypothetical protein KVP18_002810 [Porospora cf. gigantea A]